MYNDQILCGNTYGEVRVCRGQPCPHSKVADPSVTQFLVPPKKCPFGFTSTENSETYHIPTSLQDYHLLSFYPRTVRDWNILPEAIVMAASKTFKDSVS